MSFLKVVVEVVLRFIAVVFVAVKKLDGSGGWAVGPTTDGNLSLAGPDAVQHSDVKTRLH